MEFEWDPAKANSNRTKHGVAFVDAIEVFDDPDVYITPDPRSYDEPRFQAIGTITADLARKMTDEEIEAAALSDPDARPLTERELARGFRPGHIVAVRERLGLSQAAFAERFHINLRTLQDWEQGRRVPEEIARAYLRVIAHDPEAVTAALED